MNKAFSATILDLCEKRGLAQRDLTSVDGDQAKIDQGSLSKLINGKRRAQPNVAAKIIACFKGEDARRDLIHAYLTDIIDEIGAPATEVPLVRKGMADRDSLENLVEAPLYRTLRALGLAARENAEVRELVTSLARAITSAASSDHPSGPQANQERRLAKKRDMRERLQPRTGRSRSGSG